MKNPPQSRDPFIRVRSRKPSKDEEFNKEEIEFNQAKKIERKIMKVMQKTPQSAPERLTSRSTSPQKMSKNKVLPRNSRQENERKMIITPSHERNEDEPHESPPIISSEEEDKPSIVSKVKTPPPNLSIFRGGGVVSPYPYFSVLIIIENEFITRKCKRKIKKFKKENWIWKWCECFIESHPPPSPPSSYSSPGMGRDSVEMYRKSITVEVKGNCCWSMIYLIHVMLLPSLLAISSITTSPLHPDDPQHIAPL